MRNKNYLKVCPGCGLKIQVKRLDQKYCSKKCYYDYYCRINKEQIKNKRNLYNENNKEKIKEGGKKYRMKNQHKLKIKRIKYYQENKTTLGKKCKLYYNNNKEKITIHNKKYRDSHSEQVAKQQKAWRNSHKEHINKQRRIKYKNDSVFKIKLNLRTRINLALNGNIKSSSTVFLTGCDVDYLMYHLQEQFTKGMSWDNHGKDGWEIDHVKPCASFDLSKPEEQRKCFHFSNMQPLWAEDNLSKGGKYEG